MVTTPVETEAAGQLDPEPPRLPGADWINRPTQEVA